MRKPATQSSNVTSLYTADKAVDGIKKIGSDKRTLCAFTSAEETAWWQVDLGASYLVTTLTITSRKTGLALFS